MFNLSNNSLAITLVVPLPQSTTTFNLLGPKLIFLKYNQDNHLISL